MAAVYGFRRNVRRREMYKLQYYLDGKWITLAESVSAESLRSHERKMQRHGSMTRIIDEEELPVEVE